MGAARKIIKSLVCKITIGIWLIATSIGVNAEEIVGDFESVVTDTCIFRDGRSPACGRSIPVGVRVGDRLTGHFRYDIDLAIADAFSDGRRIIYSFPNGGADLRIRSGRFTWRSDQDIQFEIQNNLYFPAVNSYQSWFQGMSFPSNFAGNIDSSNDGAIAFQIANIFQSRPNSLLRSARLPRSLEQIDLNEANDFSVNVLSDWNSVTPGKWMILSQMDGATLSICRASDLLCQSKALRWVDYYRGLLGRGAIYVGAFQGTWISCVSLVSCVPLYIAAGLTIYEVYNFYQIINDPPDMNYWEVYEPRELNLALLVEPGPELEDAFAAANRYIAKHAEYVSVLSAWLVTLERYQGAQADGASAAAQMQERALARYMDWAVELALEVSVLNEEFANSFEAFTGSFQITEDELGHALTRVASEGLDEVTRRIAIDLGMGADEIEVALSAIFAAQRNDGPYDFYDSIRAASDGVREFADRYSCLQDACIPLPVSIDMKPGSTHNAVNPKSKGSIPVAILTTESFNATQVNWETVVLGPGAATATHGRPHWVDVDYDGDLDLLLHFKTRETEISCGDSRVELSGMTFTGQAIVGATEIATVGCPRN